MQGQDTETGKRRGGKRRGAWREAKLELHPVLVGLAVWLLAAVALCVSPCSAWEEVGSDIGRGTFLVGGGANVLCVCDGELGQGRSLRCNVLYLCDGELVVR